MATKISAAANPALANDIINKAFAEEQVFEAPKIIPPSDTTVELPGGYLTPAGEILRTAEVRELNGKDEEAIAKANNVGKALMTILQRGTVRIGDQKVDEKLLDNLLSGDRDMLLLEIFKATFGSEAELVAFCDGCQDMKTVNVDLVNEIKVKRLEDPINDRVFTVEGKREEITVQLPTGAAQRELINSAEKTSAELNTILLENTVVNIGSSPVYSKAQVQNLGLVDRRKIIEEINARIPGPQFDPISVNCPECESEVLVPINLGTLFRL